MAIVAEFHQTRVLDVMQAMSRTAPPKMADGHDDQASHLGKAMIVKGNLVTTGEIYVDGIVRGKIRADRLVLCAGGSMEGDIVANDVRIGGRLIGRVFALNVTLDSSADITGRIFHHTATVAKGARIDGRMPWRPQNYFTSLDQLREES